jgi:hypothetical protein
MDGETRWECSGIYIYIYYREAIGIFNAGRLFSFTAGGPAPGALWRVGLGEGGGASESESERERERAGARASGSERERESKLLREVRCQIMKTETLLGNVGAGPVFLIHCGRAGSWVRRAASKRIYTDGKTRWEGSMPDSCSHLLWTGSVCVCVCV